MKSGGLRSKTGSSPSSRRGVEKKVVLRGRLALSNGRKCRIEDLVKAIVTRESRVVATLLPPRTRLYAEQGAGRVYVLEDPPMVRRVNVSGRSLWSPNDSPVRRYSIHMATPYVVYVIGSINGYVGEGGGSIFFAMTPIGSRGHHLYLTPWTGNGGGICIGTDLEGPPKGSTEARRVSRAVYNVWSTSFYEPNRTKLPKTINEALSFRWRKGAYSLDRMVEIVLQRVRGFRPDCSSVSHLLQPFRDKVYRDGGRCI